MRFKILNRNQKTIHRFLREAQIRINLENLRMIALTKEIVQGRQLQTSTIRTIFKLLKIYHSHINIQLKIQFIKKTKSMFLNFLKILP